MTEYELASLLRETGAVISQEFEFFVTATFAMILVGYFTGDRLKLAPRIGLSLLYTGSITLFLIRYQNLTDQVLFLTTSLNSASNSFPAPTYVPLSIWIRRLVVVFGAAAAVYSLFRPVLTNDNGKSGEVA